MLNKLLHTPEGVRDIYGQEFLRKLYAQNRMMDIIRSFGYEDIKTPVFEFFDVFSGNIGTTPSKDLYKFFDKEGDTLVLRPDFTPSIARATAKYFADESMPLRFCYQGNTFSNTSAYQGRLSETTEIGAELINEVSVDADVEVISIVIEALKGCGLKDFQISIGNLEFFKGLCSEYGIDEEMEHKLREMINDKNYFGTQDLLDSLELKEEIKGMIARIPEMFGGPDILKEAAGYVSNERSLAAIKRLDKIYELLKINGAAGYVSFDLGMLSRYNYYTGIIFRAYTYGSGDAIVKGGRYDNLLSEFGKNAGAIGFCIVVDQLMSVLERQGISIDVPQRDGYLILYDRMHSKEAYVKASDIRKDSKTAILMCRDDRDDIKIKEYADRNGLTIMDI